MKIKIFDEILDRIADAQGNGLKSLMDEGNKPQMPEGSEPMDMDSEENPEGISMQKVEISKPKKPFDDQVNEAISEASNKKPGVMPEGEEMPAEEEMSDSELDELEALLSKLRS